MRHELEINELECSVDELAGRIIARRKPTAGDLRLDLMFVAKSFERIGDHATNIFEHVIYAVRGENLRHTAPFSP